MPTLTTHFQNLTDTDLLVAFLNGDRDAKNELPRRLHEKLIGKVYHLAPDLVRRDLQEDVVQQMWELLLQMKPDSYDPERSAPMTFLSKLLLRARRDVYVQNTPPGARTRPRKKTVGEEIPHEMYSKNHSPNATERREAISLDFIMDGGQSRKDCIPDAIDIEEMVIDEIDTARRLDRLRMIAPTPIVTLLNATVSDMLSLCDAAKMIGLKNPRQMINRWVAKQKLTLDTFQQM